MERGLGQEENKLTLDIITSAERLGALLDRVFAVPEGMHFLHDFPIWDPQRGPENVMRVGVFSGERLVSSACVRLAKLKTEAGRLLSVAVVGAVATDPEFRGKGLASQAVSMAVQWAEERGAALALLWGSEHSLYRKLGFEPCGAQLRVPLASFTSDPSSEAIHEGWNPALFSLVRNREGGLFLEERDQAWIAAHRHVRWFWIGDANKPRAYAALGRGIDLTGMVHEWGGARDALLALFAHIKALAPESMLLAGPKALEHYGFIYDENPVECLCLAKVSDPPAVLEAFSPGTSLERILNSNWREALSPLELSRLFFGPVDAGIHLPEPFPLPLWVWGLDAG